MSHKRKSYIQKYYRFNPQFHSSKNEFNEKSFKKVRITMPFTLQCTFCSTYHFKGSRQISLKKLMKVEQSVNFFYFFIRCKRCHNEMSIGTNPISGEYFGISGKVYEKERNTEILHTKNTTHKKGKTLEQIESELLQEIQKENEIKNAHHKNKRF